MEINKENTQADVIEAAGGIVWRESDQGRQVLLVHRPSYDDWSLPKGKRDPGERWQETALREIFEETGYQTSLVSFAGSAAYTVKGVAKIVLFWNMELLAESNFQSNDEVDHILWLPADKALDKLSYLTEAELLKDQM